MNLKLAEAIMHDYGKFLEISHGGLMGLFLSEIPESLLPYPKEKIEEALLTMLTMANFFQKDEAVRRNIKTVLNSLMFYVEDKKALNLFLERIKNKEFIEKSLEARKKLQKERLNELEKNLNLR